MRTLSDGWQIDNNALSTTYRVAPNMLYRRAEVANNGKGAQGGSGGVGADPAVGHGGMGLAMTDRAIINVLVGVVVTLGAWAVLGLLLTTAALHG